MNEDDLLRRILENPFSPDLIQDVSRIQNSDQKMGLLLENIHPHFIPRLITGLSTRQLGTIIEKSKSSYAREEAIYKIQEDDEFFISLLDCPDFPLSTKLELVNRISSEDALVQIAIETRESSIGVAIPRRIKNENNIRKIIRESKCLMARISGVKFLQNGNDEFLSDLVGSTPQKLQKTIIAKIKDEEVLFKIFVGCDDPDIQQGIIGKIKEFHILLSLKLHSSSPRVTKLIERRIEELKRRGEWKK